MNSGLEVRLKRAVPGVPVFSVRIPRKGERRLAIPAVIYRLTGIETAEAHPPTITASRYEVECRAPTGEGARNMADDILAGLGDLGRVIEQYDKAADGSSLHGGYVSHVLQLELAA